MNFKSILFLILIFCSQTSTTLAQIKSLSFKTQSGQIIKVHNGAILFDGRLVKKIKYPDDVQFNSKSNQMVEDHGTLFLFLAVAGNPNRDRLNVYEVTQTNAIMVADAILSPVKDFDSDGYLEFGGSDLTEGYPNPDSMYYIPTKYYEIRDGKIHPDKELTRSKDIEINRLYLPPGQQMDKDGFCCKVVAIPAHKHKTPIEPKSNLIKNSFLASDTISVFATAYVLTGHDEITNAEHNVDGTWMFYSNGRIYTPATSARKVKLAEIIKIDKSVLLLSWMPLGYKATRTSKTAPWGWRKLKYKEN